MSGSEEGRRLLAGAYELGDAESHRRYYADFAEHFDTAFAEELGYLTPAGIARHHAKMRAPKGAILDVGCGTGLVAEEILKLDADAVVDGVDISAEMLAKARGKRLYRDLMEADLTADFGHLPGGYAGLVSAGTFTLGHLGPQPIGRLLSHCTKGAAAVIGINTRHFEAEGFAGAMDELHRSDRITKPDYHELPIFDGRDPQHADDRAWIMTFEVKG